MRDSECPSLDKPRSHNEWMHEHYPDVPGVAAEFRFDVLPCRCVAMTDIEDGSVEYPAEHAAHGGSP